MITEIDKVLHDAAKDVMENKGKDERVADYIEKKYKSKSMQFKLKILHKYTDMLIEKIDKSLKRRSK